MIFITDMLVYERFENDRTGTYVLKINYNKTDTCYEHV